VFLDLLELKQPDIVMEAVVVLKDIFRKYPTQYEQVGMTMVMSINHNM
jgi:hypothetical protein